ncbi:MAG: ABC transporter ATP-binding protein [Acidobacteria bacterium]|nr:ABC transporter ATP-binding protein [Acidobacteriota bacterium]
MSLISVQGVSKIFRHRKQKSLLRDHLRDMVSQSSNQEEGFYALRDVSFTVQAEEAVALIGANGAGKSTMLALVSGLAEPDTGSIQVNGTIAPLLELGSGFHPDLTGRENLIMNAAILGLNEKQTKERFQAILDFSELADFIDEPLRTYSSGMVLRLAFSIATHCDPSILIIDEILGVGDSNFQGKCQHRIEGLRKEGKTFLVVSHSTYTVRNFCNRAIWLHHGVVVADGPANEVADAYEAFMVDPSQPLPGNLIREAPPEAPVTVAAKGRRQRRSDR